MAIIYDPAQQVEQQDWLKRVRELDPELFDCLLDETLYTRNGKLKVTRLSKALGSQDRATRQRLTYIKELATLDLKRKEG